MLTGAVYHFPMARNLVITLFIAVCFAFPAAAGAVRISVRDRAGEPAAEAVVELIPPAGLAMPIGRSRLQRSIAGLAMSFERSEPKPR